MYLFPDGVVGVYQGCGLLGGGMEAWVSASSLAPAPHSFRILVPEANARLLEDVIS